MLSIVLCSIDSFVAASAIGLIGCSESSRRQLILAFAACDFSATLAGISLRPSLAGSHGGAAILLAPILLVVLAAAALGYFRKFPTVLLWLPILLSLDNFVIGWLDGSAHAMPSPFVAALTSGLLAWSGFRVAQAADPLLSRKSAVLASFGLLFITFALAK